MAKNDLIKKANATCEYEPWHLVEIEKCMNDYVYFIKTYVKIQHPTKGTVPFDLYDYQVDILNLVHNNKDSLILAARQCGKTQTVSTGYILWFATFFDDKDCRIASKNMKHATEIMSRIKFSYEELPSWLKAGSKFYNRTSMEFDNGSKISTEATTEKTGRGGSPSLIFIDEIAFVSKRIQDELWASLAPSLSTGGKLVLTTTPNGDSDLFARLWRESVANINNFANILITYDRHPERGPDSGYYEEMLGKIGELRCRVELRCEFLSSDALLINSQRLIELRHSVPIFEDNGFKFWQEFNSDDIYLIGADIATGSGNDFSTIEVYNFPQLEQVAEFRSNDLNIPSLYEKIKWIVNKASELNKNKRAEVFWTFERNGVGEAISALYNTDENPPEFANLVNDNPGKIGMQTTNRNKVVACLQLKTLIEKIKNGLTINSEMTIFELKNFISTGGGYAAKKGATDDLVSALLLIIKLLKYIGEFDDVARKKLYDYNESDYNISGSSEEDDEPLPYAFL
jgi:hypothetical protein